LMTTASRITSSLWSMRSWLRDRCSTGILYIFSSFNFQIPTSSRNQQQQPGKCSMSQAAKEKDEPSRAENANNGQPKSFESSKRTFCLGFCRVVRALIVFGWCHLVDLRTHLGLLSKAVELSEPRFTYRVLRCLTATKKKFQSPDSNQAEATLKLIIDIGLPSSKLYYPLFLYKKYSIRCCH
jgi:hypothetical protein